MTKSMLLLFVGPDMNSRRTGNPRPELREHVLSASITLDVAKPLFLEFQAAGVVFNRDSKQSRGAHAHSSFLILTAI